MLLGCRSGGISPLDYCLPRFSLNEFRTQALLVRHVFGKRQNDPHKQIVGLLARLEMANARLMNHRDAVLTVLGRKSRLGAVVLRNILVPIQRRTLNRMRLTSSSIEDSNQTLGGPRSSRLWAFPVVVIGCLAIFALDRTTGTAPVQHLYYLPIILAAYYFGKRGGLTAALAAVALYHFANGSQPTHRYQESDIIQIALFLLVGVVTAKLVNDARRLRVLSMTDDLTGLHNLRSFEERLLGLVHSSRQANVPLSLLLLDVDCLKGLNDQHGHVAGSEAVRTVGHIIARQLPPDGVACRYGGDEFAVVLPCCTVSQAEQIAAGLRRVVNTAEPLLIGRRWPVGTLSISVGVACSWFQPLGAMRLLQTDDQEGEILFRAADEALYQAKASGRNRVCCVQSVRV
jgi:diguanylate cyclase (GGDEF)-like protein